jgi:hypothetical protein
MGGLNRNQQIDIAVGVTIDDAGEDVGQIREWVDVVQLAGLDQGRDGGPMLGASVGAREQRVLPVERNYPSILPMSGRMLKSFIAGMRFMDAMFD